jgi:hypothetical protein
MRENCTSGLMSGEGKRHTLIRVTALLLDSTATVLPIRALHLGSDLSSGDWPDPRVH